MSAMFRPRKLQGGVASRARRHTGSRAAAGVVGGLGERLTWYGSCNTAPPTPNRNPPSAPIASLGLGGAFAPGFALRARAAAHVFPRVARARLRASRRTEGIVGPRCGVGATSASDNRQDCNHPRLARVAEASLARAHSPSACARNARLAVRLDPASRPNETRCAYERG